VKKNGILGRVFVTSAFAATSLLAVPQIALANFYNGGISSGGNNGCRQTIEVQNPTVVSGGSSSAWVMSDNSGGQDYVQVGWDKEPSFTSPHYFVEWHSDINPDEYKYETFGVAPLGVGVDFKIDGDATNWRFLINGVQKDYEPKSALGWTPDENEYQAETLQSADTCAGSVGNKNDFHNCQWKNTADGIYYNDAVTPDHTKATFGTNAVQGSNSWQIWDTRN